MEGRGGGARMHSANNEINKFEAVCIDDRPDSKYLLCLFHYSASVKASVTVSAVLAGWSMALKRYSEGIHSRDPICWLAHVEADATRGRYWRCQQTEPFKLITLSGETLDTTAALSKSNSTIMSCYRLSSSGMAHLGQKPISYLISYFLFSFIVW